MAGLQGVFRFLWIKLWGGSCFSWTRTCDNDRKSNFGTWTCQSLWKELGTTFEANPDKECKYTRVSMYVTLWIKLCIDKIGYPDRYNFFMNLIKTRKKIIPILTIDTDMYRKYRKSDSTYTHDQRWGFLKILQI